MTPIQSFIFAANTRNSVWRFVLGIVLIIISWGLGLLLVFVASVLFLAAINGSIEAAMDKIGTIDVGGSPVSTMFILASFAGIWAGVFAAGRWLHGQAFGTFFAPDRNFRLGSFTRGIGLGLIFAALSIALGLLAVGDEIRPGMPPARTAMLIVPLIGLIFIQVTAEELVFRGYLLQRLGAWSQHWLVWAVLPSALFGLLHFDPGLPDSSAYYYAVAAFLMGLMFCAAIWRSGTLWTAIGIHLAINAVGLSIIGTEGVMSGTQMWLADKATTELTMKIDIAVAAFMLILVLSPAGRMLGPGSVSKHQ